MLDEATGSLLERVAGVARGCPTTIWGFGVGGCLSGMVGAGKALGRPVLVEDVAERVRGWQVRSAAPDPTDHLISVETLLALSGVLRADDIDAWCERWTRSVLDAQRPVPGQPRVHRPDLPGWRTTIWVDCMHTDGPALARLGRVEDALRYVEEYAAALQRDDGLFHHGYDVSAARGNGAAWGRGQGWALLGLVETLAVADHPALRDRLARLVEALAVHERNGAWGTLVDDPHAPVEHSIAGYVAYAIGRGIAAGVVDPAHADMAERAWHTTLANLHDGALTVSRATPVGEPESYLTVPTGVFAWGQGPVLHTLLDRRFTA